MKLDILPEKHIFLKGPLALVLFGIFSVILLLGVPVGSVDFCLITCIRPLSVKT